MHHQHEQQCISSISTGAAQGLVPACTGLTASGTGAEEARINTNTYMCWCAYGAPRYGALRAAGPCARYAHRAHNIYMVGVLPFTQYAMVLYPDMLPALMMMLLLGACQLLS